MIAQIRGILVAARASAVVIDVGGVGYEVAVTPRTLAALAGVGEDVVVHTHLVVREDAHFLFGFFSEADREAFRVLITVSGVGPRVAMAILSVMTAADLRRAVATEDVDALVAVPGVGKRSAQKLILDLRPKLADGGADVLDGGPAPVQVRQALEALGYSAAEIREVAPHLDAGLPIAEQLRAALKSLGKR